MMLELLVYVAERFVKHQDFRLGDYGSAQECALQLPAGQVADTLACVRFQSHQADGLLYAPLLFLLR